METLSVGCDIPAHRLQEGEATSTSSKAVSGWVCLPHSESRNMQDPTGTPRIQDPDHCTSMAPRWQGVPSKTL